jgi:hypothetical protein
METPSSSSSKYEQKSSYNPSTNLTPSAPPQSRTSNDISKRRSQSATSSRTPSNVSSTISTDQSHQLIKSSLPSTKSNQISYTKNPSTTDSHLSQLRLKTIINSTENETPSNQLTQISTANKLPPDSTLKSTNVQRPQVNITDSTFNEYHLQPNTQNISS